MSDEYESVEEEVEDEVEEESEEEAAGKKKRREKKWKVCHPEIVRRCGMLHVMILIDLLFTPKGPYQAQAGDVCVLSLFSGKPRPGQGRQPRCQLR